MLSHQDLHHFTLLKLIGFFPFRTAGGRLKEFSALELHRVVFALSSLPISPPAAFGHQLSRAVTPALLQEMTGGQLVGFTESLSGLKVQSSFLASLIEGEVKARQSIASGAGQGNRALQYGNASLTATPHQLDERVSTLSSHLSRADCFLG